MNIFSKTAANIAAAASISLIAGGVALLATAPKAEAQSYSKVADRWEFITDASDGTLYFGGPVTKVGNTAVLLIKSVNDPELPPGEEDKFRIAFNCANRTVKREKGWEGIGDNKMVGYSWFEHACSVSPLKVSRSVKA